MERTILMSFVGFKLPLRMEHFNFGTLLLRRKPYIET